MTHLKIMEGECKFRVGYYWNVRSTLIEITAVEIKLIQVLMDFLCISLKKGMCFYST